MKTSQSGARTTRRPSQKTRIAQLIQVVIGVSAGSLIWTSAHAQFGTPPPGAQNGSWMVGAPGGTGGTGGTPGDVVNSFVDTGTFGNTALGVVSVGGDGGTGSNGSDSSGNGGSGGNGGGAGAQFIGGAVTGTSASPTMLVTSTGGNGASPGTMEQELGTPGGPGGGGAGGNVSFEDYVAPGSQIIATQGWNGSAAGATAVLLQSTGGNGGAPSSGAQSVGSVDGAVGGAGGTAGGITATLGATTIASQGSGLVAVSQGGAGSDGTMGTGGLGKGAGGNGGSGGAGGSVTLNVQDGTVISAVGAPRAAAGAQIPIDQNGNVAQAASLVAGVLMQSLGGVGGNGGAASGAAAAAGAGGNAGAGGAVTLNPANGSMQVTTTGFSAPGVVLQSIGGSGGNGAQAGGAFSSHQGNGAKGGDGAPVYAAFSDKTGGNGLIATTGNDSAAVIAQSIGGGGGVGGSAQTGSAGVTFAIGGNGESGGDGNYVDLFNGQSSGAGYVIRTEGNNSSALVAQSIGGGGGAGGSAGSTSIGALAYVVGGRGGGGGSAGTPGSKGQVWVDAVNNGIVYTSGDHSKGLVAQAVGGGGGDGGSAASMTSSTQLDINVSLGGSGGGGGDGGNVQAVNNRQILTSGADAWGLLAQSVGGGGGNGGSSKADSWTLAAPGPVPNLSLAVSVGGSGKSGGTGGDVTAINNGVIMTSGAGAHGMLAQSIGGGGGNGGDSSALNESVGTGDSLNVTVNVGGQGGTGGSSGNVTATNAAGQLIWTIGDSARGIFAQSISGGGGSGGTAKTDSDFLKKAGADSTNFNITLGGTGGGGGDSTTVAVNNDGNVMTLGNTADAIFAQSVGGGGGLGGHASTEGAGGKNTANLTVGGSSGTPSNGGTVTVTNNGNVYTRGGNSAGIYAQSVGGGGGKAGTVTKGGDAQTTLSLKDFLADSSVAGYTATYAGGTIGWKKGVLDHLSMSDLGNFAGLYRAALAKNPPPANTEPDQQGASNGLNLGSGDKTPTGHVPDGSGGTVQVTNNGQILTNGPLSAGIWAQSVGGGGGEVGATHVAATTSGALTNHDTTANVGGTGFNSGDGGTVTVYQYGQVVTAGDASYGVLGQSLGGGGGHATTTDSVDASSTGMLDITMGGGGNVHGNGGAVNVQATNNGNAHVWTSGNDAIGIFAQSIGGGGGAMAVMHTTASADGNTQGSTLASGDSRIAGMTTNLSIGSTYVGPVGPNDPPSNLPQCNGYLVASCGSGGSVTVAADNISTSGRNAHGILAQSFGGSGGTLIGATPTSGTPFVNTATTWGTGGSIDVTVNNSISTTGAGAYGVLAQSVGAGGLLAGDLSATNLATGATAFPAWPHNGDPATKFLIGAGGDVTVNVGPNAVVSTTGANAHAIFAQSVGGGGGLVQTTGGTYMGTAGGAGKAGAVSVNIGANATVQASGAGSSAVFTNSEGQAGTSSNLYVTNSGNILGNTSAAAIVFSGNNNAGGNGSLDNHGTVSNAGGIAVQAIGTIGSNSGAFAAVNNQSGARITGDLQLGNQGWLNNDGVWTIGTSSTVGTVNNRSDGSLDLGSTMSSPQVASTSTLWGTLNSAGTILTTVDFTKQTSSNLIVSNGNANLTGGQFVVTVPADAGLQPSSVQVLAAGQINQTGNVTAIDSSNSSVTYQIGVQNDPIEGGSLTVTPNTQFAAVGTQRGYSANQQSLATHLDAGFTRNMTPEMARVYGRLSNLDDAHVQSSMDTLGNEAVQSVGVARLAASQDFVERMNSCPQFDGANGLQVREQDCLWSRAVATDANRDASANAVGYGTHSSKLQIGGQKAVGNDWFLGGSIGYDQASLSAPQTSVSGTGWTAALIAKKQLGDWIFSGAIDAGTGSYDSRRQVLLGDVPETASATFDATHVGLHARAARQIGMDGWYLKPYVDLHAVHLHTGAYSESGAGGLNLQVGAANGTAYTVSPMLEAGSVFGLGNGMTLRGFVSGGVAFSSQNAWTANASLQGSVPEAGTFRTTAELPNERFKLNVGMDLIATKNLDVRLEYSGEFAHGFRANGAMLKAAYAF
ncbi:hypothetical protein WKW79_11660 [Variovorax robiniae]|uniref:Autotransporter domain-containing protein n=1 Tax=Variovorax robiniae TaxID=1836199 RepID=A0ABU8X6E0_9BURK